MLAGAACLATLLVLGACGTDDATPPDRSAPTVSPVPYVVDGDGAIDDLKALVYLLQRPDVDVRAVTMSGTGVAHCPNGAENAASVLRLLGRTDIPVACGRTTPLAGSNQAPAAWRDQADTLGGTPLPRPGPLSPLAAPDLLAATIGSSQRKVVLVALGPLTNIAEAVQRDRSLADRIEMVFLMGGAVEAGGNVLYANDTAEFNIWADPNAAALVLASGVPITLVPLDATNAVPVTPRFREVFAAHHATPASRFIASYLRANPLLGGQYQWDELTAVASTDPGVVRTEERRLVVVETPGPDQGATIERSDGRTVRVAVSTDRRRFEERFFTAVTGVTATDVPEWTPDVTVSWDGTRCRYTGPRQLPARVVARLDNTGSETFALVTGRYAPGMTRQDVLRYRSASPSEPPPWWTQLGVYPSPAGAHDVWVVDTGGPGITALCFVDPGRSWEVAGPRLPD